MPVKLRLRRQGRKGKAHFAIVAADIRAPRDGRFIEKIGHYDPVAEPGRLYVDHEAALKWLKDGAQPTHTVRSLLRHAGVTVKFALYRQGKSEEEAEKIFNKWWEEKKAKKKKKIISTDVHGNPLEEVPETVKKKPKAETAPPKPKTEEEAAPEALEAKEEAPAAEAKEEAPAEEKKEEAPAEEAKEEAPAEEKKEEAPAEEAKEEAPAEEKKKEEAPEKEQKEKKD